MGKNDAAERVLLAIQEEAKTEFLPHLGADAADAVERLVREKRPKTVLEIGTLVGYMTIRIARALPKGGSLVAVEIAEDLARRARTNLEFAGLADVAAVVRGDAREALASIRRPFDFVLMDAERNQYRNYLRVIEPHLAKGAVIVAVGTGSSDPAMQRYLDHVRLGGKYDSASATYEEKVEFSTHKGA